MKHLKLNQHLDVNQHLEVNQQLEANQQFLVIQIKSTHFPKEIGYIFNYYKNYFMVYTRESLGSSSTMTLAANMVMIKFSSQMTRI